MNEDKKSREKKERETGARLASLGQAKNKSASRQDGRRLNDSQGYGDGIGERTEPANRRRGACVPVDWL